MKKVGILGSGIVGKVLANGFIKHGYQAMIGSRSPEKLSDWKNDAGENAFTGTFEQTAEFGEILVLAVQGNAALEVLESIGANNLSNKTIIDATNPIDMTRQPVNGVLNFFTDLNESLMEKLQKAYHDANFVKAFSSVGRVNPQFSDGKPSMFICGNNNEAKSEVKEILDLFGWETEDMGAIEAARAIEPLCMLWCIPGFTKNQWGHAFKLIKL
jgi:predicted dinucleotide-binding enzyme